MISPKPLESETGLLKNMIAETFVQEKVQTTQTSFLENLPSLSDVMNAQVEIAQENGNTKIELFYFSENYSDQVIKKIDQRINDFMIDQYSSYLATVQEQFKEATQKYELLQKTKEQKPTQQEVIKTPNENATPRTITKDIPPEILKNLAKLEAFRQQKEKVLNDLRTQLEQMQKTSLQAPLVMLTSNLQKNYEMQITLLDSKMTWLNNSDMKELKEVEAEKESVFNKLILENQRLRDESYYIKGQQDKALREKYSFMLKEEQNVRELLEIVKELQKSIDTGAQSNPSSSTTIGQNTDKNMGKASVTAINTAELNEALQTYQNLQKQTAEVEAQITKWKAEGVNSQHNIKENPFSPFQYTNFTFFVSMSLLTLYLLLGLIFGSNGKITNAKTIANILKAPHLGTIPDLPNEGLENAKSKSLTETIDHITDKILIEMKGQNFKTLTVLSPEANDGRTQLTGMLCLSFNLKKNMKIIALDTCFDNPQLADFLGLKNKSKTEEGLISYIKHLIQSQEISENENNHWLAKLVKPCPQNGVFVISPGIGDLNDDYSFNSKIISTMYEGLEKYIDLIISDTPPLNSPLSYVTNVIAENTKGSILLLRKDTYSKKELENLKKKIATIPIIGFVLK